MIGGRKNQGIFQNNWIIPASIFCQITSFACSEMQKMCGYVHCWNRASIKTVENIAYLLFSEYILAIDW